MVREKANAAKIDNVDFEVSIFDEEETVGAKYDVIMGHSILHLLRDKDATLKKILTMLKPGGVFISSTACIAERMGFLRYILPIGAMLGLVPPLRFFTGEELKGSHVNAGFSIDYAWRANEKSMALFLVAKKGN